MQSVYFDYASTTPLDSRVTEKMIASLNVDGTFGNPASTTHRFGWLASEEVELARETVANVLGADPREIVWTSGATESNNLAIRGVFQALAETAGRSRVITLGTEHKAVLDTCTHLKNADVIVLHPKADGLVCLNELEEVLNDQTLLVSVMLVNNETGVVQPIHKIAEMAHSFGAFVHSDLAQSVGKLAWSVDDLGIDLGSLSAHKTHGPKGVGALYVRRQSEVRVAEQQHGGQHERGMRSGTLPTHQIVGMSEAFQLAKASLAQELERMNGIRDHVEAACLSLGGVRFNGLRGVPHILNVTFEGIDAEQLMAAMPLVAVSTGSACNSATLEPSHVLQSMGLSRQQGLASLRISFGRMTTDDDVAILVKSLGQTVSQLRSSL